MRRHDRPTQHCNPPGPGGAFRARRLAAALGFAALAYVATPARADGPLATDNAGVAARGDCAVELTGGRDHDSGAGRSTGADGTLTCGIGWRSELAIGAGGVRADGRTAAALAVGGKTALVVGDDTHAGLAVAWNVARSRLPDAPWAHDATALWLAATVPLAEADVTLHANVGTVREAKRAARSTTWNFAGEWSPAERWFLTAESYGDDRSAGWVRLGTRYFVVKERVSLYAGRSRQAGFAASGWLAGVRAVF